MRIDAEDLLTLAATDLAHFIHCAHLSRLQVLKAERRAFPEEYDDPSEELLKHRGLEHEARYVESLKARGRDVVTVVRDDTGDGQSAAQRTLDVMRSGADVIYQGTLIGDGWIGKPDFLLRTDERGSVFGDWSYEVADAKLTREAKGGALLQICLYSHLLEGLQETRPVWMYLALGGPDRREERFRFDDYSAYFRLVKTRLEQLVEDQRGQPVERSPDPCSFCVLCDWKIRCRRERREDDHLSLVAGIAKRQRQALEEANIPTLTSLATLQVPEEPGRVYGMRKRSIQKVQQQASIQLRGRETGSPQYEFIFPVEADRGLGALPEPSPGDLFLDLEGGAFIDVEGREYLFGWVDTDGSYQRDWAFTPSDERHAFERFIDLVHERLKRHPDLHVYHFAPYETVAFKRLMGRYGTREKALDDLLRGEIFVDLHRVVRQGLRCSVESYSIKELEPFYGFERRVTSQQGMSSMACFEVWLGMGGVGVADDTWIQEIEEYNREDCLSTLRLRNWLEERRTELAQQPGIVEVPRPSPPTDPEVDENLAVRDALVDALTEGLPDDPEQVPESEHPRWLLAQLLGFHKRDEKAGWWRYFNWLELTPEEWIEDRSVMGGLSNQGVVDEVGRSLVHRYCFPPQDHRMEVGDTPADERGMDADGAPGTVHALDDQAGTIDLKRGKGSEVPHPRALIPLDHVGTKVQQESLQRIARAVLNESFKGPHEYPPAIALLTRKPPGQSTGERGALRRQEETPLAAAVRLVNELDGCVLPIQGPPGTGKTFTGARMILELIRQGKRVGVTAPSHKVVGKLLEEVCIAAAEQSATFTAIQKAQKHQYCGRDEIERTDSNSAVKTALEEGKADLAAGTAWLWSRPEMVDTVDVLVIDEAGQFSLASAVAVSPAARSLVLLGDPQQLEQPQQGTHPPGSDASCLEHLLRGQPTIASDQGLFLESTYRMHPDVCGFISETFYDRQLTIAPTVDTQWVAAGGPVGGTGIRLIPIDHRGNTSESKEEVKAVRELVDGPARGGSHLEASQPHREGARWQRHPRRRAVQRAGLRVEEGPSGRRGHRDGGQVPGPGSSRRDLLDGEQQRGRRTPRHELPLQSQSPQRRDLESSVPCRGGGEPGRAGAPVHHAGPDAFGESAVSVGGMGGFWRQRGRSRTRRMKAKDLANLGIEVLEVMLDDAIRRGDRTLLKEMLFVLKLRSSKRALRLRQRVERLVGDREVNRNPRPIVAKSLPEPVQVQTSDRGADSDATVSRKPAPQVVPDVEFQRPGTKEPTPARPSTSEPDEFIPDLPPTAQASWTLDDEWTNRFVDGVETASPTPWCVLRRAMEQLALIPGFSELITLEANTIEEFPHQTDVALRVLRQMGGRAILADEVGLGKTIEAGIILKELIVRGLARRILIITPASLVAQWQAELENKFFERFQTPEHPHEWRNVQRAIVSLARARHQRHFDAVTRDPWDLVIVDEAHKAKRRTSRSYKLLSGLQRDYLLLLTATPLQNDLEELYNLVTLLRPGQFGSWRQFKRKYLGRGRKRIPEDPGQIREIAAEVMVRTRRANVDLNLPSRNPEHPRIELTAEEDALYRATTSFLRRLFAHGFHAPTSDDRNGRGGKRSQGRGLLALELIRLGQRLCSSTAALAASLEAKSRKDILLPEFRTAARELAAFARTVPDQAKLMELDRQLERFPDRVIVFSEHLATVDTVIRRVQDHGRAAIRFDGSLSKDQRVKAIRRFRSEPGAVFISTRSGTEGLNLQFCNVMVNYELPWNPMLIEQRIGRIHRIGQERDVFILNFASRGTVEDRVLQVLDEKIRLFELVVGELDVILGQFGDGADLEKRIGDAWLGAGTDKAFDHTMVQIGKELEASRETGLEQERMSSLIAPPDPAELLEAQFATLTIPARVRLGYGTRHLRILSRLSHRREQLGLHVHELQQALDSSTAHVENAGMSDFGPSVRITGLTSRSRAVYLTVAADRLPMTLLDLDADPEAPLLPQEPRATGALRP